MKTKLLIATLVFASLTFGQNLIQNGNFEQFTGNIPDFWTINNGSTAKETTIFNEGTSSLKAILTSPGPGGGPYTYISQIFTLDNTDNYTLKFDYFLPGSPATNSVDNLSYEMVRQGTNAFLLTPSNNIIQPIYGSWITVTYNFRVAIFLNGATSTDVKFNLLSSTGFDFNDKIIYYDKISVTKNILSINEFETTKNIIKSVTDSEIVLTENLNLTSFNIYSIDGKKININDDLKSNVIDISSLSKGIYILSLNDNKAIKNIKFIK